jgi:hypothetical protein
MCQRLLVPCYRVQDCQVRGSEPDRASGHVLGQVVRVLRSRNRRHADVGGANPATARGRRTGPRRRFSGLGYLEAGSAHSASKARGHLPATVEPSETRVSYFLEAFLWTYSAPSSLTSPEGTDDDAAVERIAGYSDPVMAGLQLRALVPPTLRADIIIQKRYRPSVSPISVPVTAVDGTDDQTVTLAAACEWEQAPTATAVVNPSQQVSRSRNSPFAGMRLPGRVQATFLRGEPAGLGGKPAR